MLQSSYYEKENGETSKKLLFWIQIAQKGVIMGHSQNEKLFWAEITKAEHHLSETFLRYYRFWLSHDS